MTVSIRRPSSDYFRSWIALQASILGATIFTVPMGALDGGSNQHIIYVHLSSTHCINAVVIIIIAFKNNLEHPLESFHRDLTYQSDGRCDIWTDNPTLFY